MKPTKDKFSPANLTITCGPGMGMSAALALDIGGGKSSMVAACLHLYLRHSYLEDMVRFYYERTVATYWQINHTESIVVFANGACARVERRHDGTTAKLTQVRPP